MKRLNKAIIKTGSNHLSFIFISLMIMTTTSYTNAANAANAANDSLAVKIIIKPNQCIALHQGQQCYVDIDLTWSAQQIGDYCLYSSQHEKALQCWNGQSKGTYKKEVVSSENIEFTIRPKALENVLATEVLKMAWVYRKASQAKTAWRLF